MPFRQLLLAVQQYFRFGARGAAGIRSVSAADCWPMDHSECRITIWYGMFQVFGRPGVPQRWASLPGDVQCSDPVSLTYRLNGGAEHPLSVGPDGRRLASPGDFNIDIPTTDLLYGLNRVEVIARGASGQKTVRTVQIEWCGETWPLPYQIDWRTITDIREAVQVVDGKWEVADGRLRPTVHAYDRVVAIGDVRWRDYEVTVPITVAGVEAAGFNTISNAPGVGVRLRWNGHTETPYSRKRQPLFGWLPVGASAWYDFGAKRFKLHLNARLAAEDGSGGPIEVGSTWIFKVRVETLPAGRPKYRFKFWPAGQSEPATWSLSGAGDRTDPEAGSVLLVAHHVDARFGNVTVLPVGDRPSATEMLITRPRHPATPIPLG